MMKMAMSRKMLIPIVFACLCAMLMAAVLVPASPAKAAYDYVYKKDAWGNKVEISARVNQYSYSEVEVKAYAKTWGVSLMNFGYCFPAFFGDYLKIYVYGYVRSSSGYWNKVYATSYKTYKGWMSTKTVRWTRIPKGLDRIVVSVSAKFVSVPFGDAYISKTLYAYG